MKKVIELGDKKLAIFNNSNNWIISSDDNSINSFDDKDEIVKQDLNFLPKTFTLHITNMCNMNCSYCFARACCDENKVMDLGTAYKIAKLIQRTPGKKICIDFHGGEPLTQKKLICDMVEIFENTIPEKDIEYYIQTNATLLDDEIVQFMKEKKFIVGISLDGPEEINDRNRVFNNDKGSFSEIMKGVGCLKKWDVPFSVLTVVTDPEDLVKIYEFYCQVGIDSMQFMPVMAQGRAKDKGMCISDWQKYIEQENIVFNRILDSCKEGKYKILSPALGIIKKIVYDDMNYICYRNPCGAGLDILSIDADGYIYPCDAMSGIDGIENVVLGNVNDIEDLRDITGCKNYKNCVTCKKIHIPKCESCFCKEICCGGCKSDVYNAYGVFDRETPLCSYYEGMIKSYFFALANRKEDVIKFIKQKE